MVGQLYHLPRAEARERADELLERFDLTEAGGPSGEDVLGRHAPAAGPRRRARLPPAGDLPRRADDRPGPARPVRHVGDDRGARRRGRDRAADHAVPRGGRPARRPDRGHRPRQRDRRGHVGRAQGPRRRRAARRHARGPAPTPRRRSPRWPRWPPTGRRSRTASCTSRSAGAPARSPRRCGASTPPASGSTTSRCAARRSTTSSSRSPATPPRSRAEEEVAA